MADGLERKSIKQVEQEVNDSKLSRRGLLDHLKGVGIGFGAAFLLGVRKSEAHAVPEATAQFKSTNPALNTIIEEGTQAGEVATQAEGRGALQQMAYWRYWYRRYFSRWYRRW